MNVSSRSTDPADGTDLTYDGAIPNITVRNARGVLQSKCTLGQIEQSRSAFSLTTHTVPESREAELDRVGSGEYITVKRTEQSGKTG